MSGSALGDDSFAGGFDVSTENSAAYQAYLRGLESKLKGKTTGHRAAVVQFERAVELDPGFIEALTQLTESHLWLYFNGDKTAMRRRQAESGLRRAKALDPDLAAVRSATGTYYLVIEDDSERAYEIFSEVAEEQPGKPGPIVSLGLTARYQGRFEEAVELLTSAYKLGPASARRAGEIGIVRAKAKLAKEIGRILVAMRAYADADKWLSSAVEMVPDDPVLLATRALNVLAWKGCPSTSELAPCSTQEARKIVAESPIRDHSDLYYLRLLFDLYDASMADLSQSQAIYSQIVERLEGVPERPGGPGNKSGFFWLEAIAYERLGQQDRAIAMVKQCYNELQGIAKSAAVYLSRLGIACAYLGYREEAIAVGERAVAEVSRDHYFGPKRREHLAVNLLLLGEHERALEELEYLAATRYVSSISISALRLDPTWDPLRSLPRFHALLARASSGSTNK